MLLMHGFATPARENCIHFQLFQLAYFSLHLQSMISEIVTWRQRSLDLVKRGPVRPRASVALKTKVAEKLDPEHHHTNLTHLSQDQKSVRRGSKEGRLGDDF